MKRFLLIGAGLLAAFSAGAKADDKIDFAKQIRPIFADTCYKCHAGAKHKGDLKLDSVDSIRKGGKDAKDKVVVAGNPDKSDLYRRILLVKDDDDAMPPDGKGDHLTKEKADLIKAWIAQGANFGDWKEDKATASADGGSTTKTADADEGPKEIPLPVVPVADAASADKLRQVGALVLPLAQNTNLLSIEFTSNAGQITDQQVALLVPVAQQVYDLNLANTKVTDSGLAALEGMKNLHRLHLEKTGITDAGLAHIKGLGSLEYLNLYSTGVTDAGLSSLGGLKALKNAYFWQSKVTDAGVEKLKATLASCSIDNGYKEPVLAPGETAPAELPMPPKKGKKGKKPVAGAAVKETAAKLVIRKAVYGELPAGPMEDVTEKLTVLVKNDTLSVEVTNDLFGDAAGTGKKLKVDYTFDGKELTKTVDEGQTLTISDKGE